MKRLLLVTAALVSAGLFLDQGASAQAPQMPAMPSTKAPAGAELYFIAPVHGAKVKSPVVVRFGLRGMGVAPAGIQMANTGHHHLLVDTPLPADLTKPIPVVENKVIHYGMGQTETTVTLAPGTHTLQLVLGDHLHIPFAPPVVSKKIMITVE